MKASKASVPGEKKKKEHPRNKQRRETVAQADWALLERKALMLDESQVTLIRAWHFMRY